MWEKDGKMYHVGCKKGDVGRYVLLPGDPFRTDYIAKYLDNAEVVAHNREHKTWTGTLLGEKVSVTSTGMGCPSTAIAVEELIACGADTFIRIGTSGPMCREKRSEGALGGIVTGAVRDEGTTKQYVPIEYPAISDRKLVSALVDSAEKLGYKFDEGLSYTKDSLYTLLSPETIPLGPKYEARKKVWEKAGVLVTEMESAAVLVISSIRGCRAAAIMAYSDIPNGNDAMNKAIETSCEAIKYFIKTDAKK